MSLIDDLHEARAALIRHKGDTPDFLLLTNAQADALRCSVEFSRVQRVGPGMGNFIGLPVVIRGSSEHERRIAMGQVPMEVS